MSPVLRVDFQRPEVSAQLTISEQTVRIAAEPVSGFDPFDLCRVCACSYFQGYQVDGIPYVLVRVLDNFVSIETVDLNKVPITIFNPLVRVRQQTKTHDIVATQADLISATARYAKHGLFSASVCHYVANLAKEETGPFVHHYRHPADKILNSRTAKKEESRNLSDDDR